MNEEIKIQITSEELEKAFIMADKLMKASNGHDFMTILKTRCQNCGASPKTTRRCGQWFATYLNKLRYVLYNEKWKEEIKKELKVGENK